MELSRQDYPAIVASLTPTQASAVLTERIRLISKINSDIADWLSERRRVEDAYFLGLRRLARRQSQDASAALGVFQTPWQRILTATESLAESHETLSHGIEADVERPLKEYATRNNDMQSISTMQQDLANLAKELESAKKKADKLKDKGPKAAAKTSSAVLAAQEVAQQWESRAPFVFEQLQAVDEHRLNHLRDVLTQFQTHEADHIERTRRYTESCLNALLNVQTDEEITAFTTKVTGGRAPVSRTTTTDAAATTLPPSSGQIPAATGEPLRPPPRIHDDAASQRSGRSNKGRLGAAPEPVGHMRLGGLKRLGTVMGRRKSIVHHSTGNSGSPERKFRSPFTAFRKSESTRNFQQVEMQHNPSDYLAPITSRDDLSLRRPASSPRETARSDSISASHQRPTTPNGAGVPEESSIPETTGKHGNSMEQAPATAQPPRIDAEGYSERPANLDEITRLQKEAAAAAEEPGLNLTIRDQPIEEDEGEAKMALNEVANTLRLKAQQSGLSRGVGTLRGRREVRNTIFVPNPPSEDSSLSPLPGLVAGPPPVSPSHVPKMVASPPSSHDDHALSDTTSIHSSQTLHSLSGPVSHPDMPEPGLNASIVETVNAWFSDGAVTRSFVVGELALAYNSTTSPPSDPELVRLNNFDLLEKVAANPILATEAGHSLKGKEKENGSGNEERKGEYLISLPSIARSTPTVAFKYQIHLNPSNFSAYCPIIFNPVWNLEEFQASVIITYSINPNFISAESSTPITLKNLVLTVNLDLSPQEDETTKQPREVARATGAVMYPNTGATFRRKTSAVTWRMSELEVTTAGDQRFLARFSTTVSGPRKGRVDAKFDVLNANSGDRLGISVQTSGHKQDKKADDPFADESLATGNGTTESPEPSPASKTWEEVSTRRILTVGRYISFG
ncbi:hypothetical protein RJZ56_003089 [Blastomyces dermatitidis]|uniref:Fes/CIP4 domain-containing protein n=1 Tax=Ajellomyces dermatitidis (strain ER-3 / ATCC MYA-2586) TaxID=559297 RepID=A0ABP2ELW3_AJEDR|nr:fes/CIP4 domain-containing protein [Blastomyces dermatitidis ER-3]EEQ84244.2 fes/CIP4 domain-containing protein [Blastomyces dermatitidis ER-3]EQL28445.1 hypothetical protein BDFG_08803 [Blastomyces dermatitidis ATCC 26199]